MTNAIHSLRQFARRALPAPSAPCERPEFLVPSLAALALSLGLLIVQRWPLSMFFAPTFVIACRYYELAHLRTVRPSRLAFLLILTCAAACGLWALTHRGGGLEQPLTLALAACSLAITVHLFTTQRRLVKGQITRSLLHTVDEDAPYWACGGPLAILPVLLLLGCISGLMWWRSPLLLCWGLAGIPVLAAQLRTHPWFPRLAVAWLATWLGIEIYGTFAEGGDDAVVSATVAASILAIAIYLLQSPRVHRTFRDTAAATNEAPAAITIEPRAPLQVQAARAVSSVRSTG